MDDTARDAARNAALEVVSNQIKENNPPETKDTLDRLLAEGHSRDDAMKLIACVVVAEVFAVMTQGREFDLARYVDALDDLPRLPED